MFGTYKWPTKGKGGQPNTLADLKCVRCKGTIGRSYVVIGMRTLLR